MIAPTRGERWIDLFFFLGVLVFFVVSFSLTLHSLKHRSTTERRNAKTAARAASVSSVGEMRSRSWSIRSSGVAGGGGSGQDEGKVEGEKAKLSPRGTIEANELLPPLPLPP